MNNWNGIKPKVNLIIDALMFILLMAVAGLGFLMKVVLFPGYKINEIYGTGTELYFLGMDRHQWGAIHLYLALVMLLLLVLHIIFHWDMIVCILRKMVAGRTARIVTGVLTGIFGFSLLILPFYLNPEVADMQRTHNRNRVPDRYDRGIQSRFETIADDSRQTQENKTEIPESAEVQSIVDETVIPDTEIKEVQHHNQVNIDGTMTLAQISSIYNISISELARCIDIPEDYANERLGRLKRMYGFEMDDLRLFVVKNSNK